MRSWIDGRPARAVLIVAVLCLCTCCLGCAGAAGERDVQPDKTKEVAIEIIGRDGSLLLEDTVRTDAETLGDLLDDENLIGYDKTGLGRFITEMAGEKADPASEYWSIWVNGSYGQYGADNQLVKDGDRFTFELVTY